MRSAIHAAVLISLALAPPGCSAVRNAENMTQPATPAPHQQAGQIEPMLTAAGFAKLPADTPERRAQMQSLVPFTVSYYVGKTGKLHYWMADPEVCHCLFHGDEQAYQRYQNLKLRTDWAQNQSEAARENVEAEQSQEMEEQEENFNPYGMGLVGPAMY